VYRAAGERTAREVVTSKEGGGVLRVRERKIQKDALDDDEDADCENADADDGGDPVNRRVGRPAWRFY